MEVEVALVAATCYTIPNQNPTKKYSSGACSLRACSNDGLLIWIWLASTQEGGLVINPATTYSSIIYDR